MNKIDQIDLTETYRTSHPTVAEYTLSSSTPRTFSRIDDILGHKTNFDKFKSEMIPNIFSDQNRMKLVIHSKRNIGKVINIWKLNNTLLNNQQIKERIKREVRSISVSWDKTEKTIYQNLQDVAKAALRKAY